MFRLRPLPAVCAFAAVALGSSLGPRALSAHRTSGASAPTDACTLLTVDEVSAALEVKSMPGRHPSPTFTASCLWTDDTAVVISHRRVTLSIISTQAFDIAKRSPVLTVTPVTGIGDDAYYEMFKSESPALNVRKGSVAFTIRILNGLKFKPFTIDQEKAKEAALGQAAAKAL